MGARRIRNNWIREHNYYLSLVTIPEVLKKNKVPNLQKRCNKQCHHHSRLMPKQQIEYIARLNGGQFQRLNQQILNRIENLFWMYEMIAVLLSKKIYEYLKIKSYLFCQKLIFPFQEI